MKMKEKLIIAVPVIVLAAVVFTYFSATLTIQPLFGDNSDYPQCAHLDANPPDLSKPSAFNVGGGGETCNYELQKTAGFPIGFTNMTNTNYAPISWPRFLLDVVFYVLIISILPAVVILRKLRKRSS